MKRVKPLFITLVLLLTISGCDYTGEADVPEDPVELSATAVSHVQINLSWNDKSINEEGFEIERKGGNSDNYEYLRTLEADTNSYSDIGLSPLTTYYYRIRAYNSHGYSGYSNEVKVTTWSGTPKTPTGLKAIAVSGSQIYLSWNDTSEIEEGFEIQRRVGETGVYMPLATVDAGVSSYSDTGLSALTTYYYRVRAFNRYAYSGYSNEAFTATPNPDSWVSTSTLNAPSPRRYQTAIWTGKKMIIWGGAWEFKSYDTGGIYDPDTDTWTSTSTLNAPSGRWVHTAVWTGQKMIVWGGRLGYSGTWFNTGGIYDPATDTWSPTSTINAPSPRWAHTAIWTGQKMIIWGGGDANTYFNDGGIYDPSTDTWKPISTLNAPSPGRFLHTAVWTGEKMIVWGGVYVEDGNEISVNTGGIYDPATDTWSPISTVNAPSPRYHHVAIWTGTKMVIWGGTDNDSDGMDTGGIYDPLTDAWTAVSTVNAPAPRRAHTAIWPATIKRMIVWGGSDGANYHNTGGIYNPATNSWESTISTLNAPSGRRNHTAVWTGQKMIVWGGYAQGGAVYFDTGGVYTLP
jgi:N-acetylneuraminic acid mutarotase